MTRDQKIEALLNTYFEQYPCETCDVLDCDDCNNYKSLITDSVNAGIALRDAELLEKLGTFDENPAIKQGFVLSAMRPAFLFRDQVSERYFTENNALEIAIDLARYQHEQFMKILKQK